MKLAKYEAYIGELESLANKSHLRFRLKVIAIVALGYAVMAVLLLAILVFGLCLLLARLIGTAAKMLALGIHFGVGMCRGLWVKNEPPRGVELSSEQMRPLVAVVDEISAQLEAPKIHKVFIAHDCNAMALQRPRFGPFGPFRNEVTVGLPLLAVFSLEEVRAVIAHEIGHIRHSHSRFGLRVGQILSAWTKALDEISKNKMGARAVVDVFNWYTPKLRGAQFVLSRIAEREANRAEISVAGVSAHVRVFVALAIYSEQANRALADATKDSFSRTEMPDDLFVDMCRRLRTAVPESVMRQRVADMLAVPYDPFSTHPSMSQSLRENGVDPSIESVLALAPLPSEGRQSAGEAIYGEQFESIIQLASEAWANKTCKHWEKSQKSYADRQGELNSLLETVRDKPPTDEERVELAWRLHTACEFDEAMKWIEPVKALSPKACLLYGLLLKQRKDPDWVQWVEAAATSMEVRKSASEVLANHYTSLGDRAEVQRVVAGLDDLRDYEVSMANEFRQLSKFWTYGPCTWSPEQIQSLTLELAKNRTIKRAYFVSRTGGDPRYDNHCVVVEYGHGGSRPQDVANWVCKLKFPGKCMVFTLQKAPVLVSGVPGGLVYEKKRAKLPWSKAA